MTKVALVTGGTRGIGAAISLALKAAGYKIAANYAGNDEAASAFSKEHGIHVYKWNVGDYDACVKGIAAVEGELGPVDVLVNNAGIMDNFVPAAEVQDADWERVLAVNTTGPLRTMRKCLPIFAARGSGSIVNVASIGGLNGSRAGAAYTASKHALIGLTKNVAFQYARAGVRCNAIAPGGVNTAIMSGTTPHAAGMELAMAGIKGNIRMGEPEEIATVALFLAASDSSLVNGAVVVADAGWTAY